MLPDVHNTQPLSEPVQQAAVVTTPTSNAEGIARVLERRSLPFREPDIARAQEAKGTVELPGRIPADCINRSASTYKLNPMVLLAVLKVESDGRTGIVSKNTNGTADIGPAQFNTGTWANLLQTKYKIPREALINDMCQSVHAMAFALRTEINQAGGDLWKGIGNYHSRTPKFHVRYVSRVSAAHKKMLAKGKF